MPYKDPVERREYHREYMKKVWYPRNRKKHKNMVARRRKDLRAWVHELKISLSCNRCPEGDVFCLDFHHRRKDKELSIAKTVTQGWSKKRILEEIAKCEILCSNCHRKEHSAGWSRLAARRAHNPEVGGSNPSPATMSLSSSPV